ncbi:ATP-grasp domain-containing protein [Thermotalea metallivorans]|uniref:Alanine-anticapsin ligase BacD n=1 Tax=Thermotalea metallivorans TaxID=520762 RepID=A0A140LCF5_9FIRM|nr:ATP-grasp domain-containing protein [Thermotalea metallivorans]KXG78230.1 Alanine-anticapsin ligase BacD [Thermotalea metallivorans]
MSKKKLLFIRGGIHKEFAYKTFFKKNCEMIMMDNPSNEQLAFADYPYCISDVRDTEEMFNLSLDIYKNKGFDGICTFMNSPIIAIGMLSDYLGFDYLSEETARILNNKYEVRRFLNVHGVEQLQFFKILSYEDLKRCADVLKYPFILKPTDNASSKGVIIINNSDELESSYKFSLSASFNKELIAEEFIDGDEYCVEVLIYNYQPYIISISKKYVTKEKYCIELMDITPAPITEELRKIISDYITDTVRTLNIGNWLLHIEFKVDESLQPNIIEINPRAAGGNLIESIYHLKGLNLFDYFFDIMLKNEINQEKLVEEIRKPYNGYSLFYSFINPTTSGIIKKIRGIEDVRKSFKNDSERLILFYNEGAFLPEPSSNSEFRGSLYLFDNDIDLLVSRTREIEKLIHYEFEGE